MEIERDVPFDMIYDDPTETPPLHIRIYAGEQTIDSSNVMEYLRYRKGYRRSFRCRARKHHQREPNPVRQQRVIQ